MCACSAAAKSARCSTCVMPESTLITARRLKCETPLLAARTKWSRSLRVRSKSATTPSMSGATRVTSRASRPSMSRASGPKATASPVSLLTATTAGSSTTTPRPRTEMMTEVEPMSIAIESETRSRKPSSDISERFFCVNVFDIKPSSFFATSVSGEGRRGASAVACARGRLMPVHLEDGHGLDAVLDHDGRARAELAVRLLGGLRRCVAQEDLSGQRVLLQPRGEVDRVADGRVLAAALRADVADGGDARVQSDADGDFAQAVGPQLPVDDIHLALHGDGCAGLAGDGAH